MTDRKSEQVGFRLPPDLYDRLMRLRETYAPRQDKTDFYIEAVRFYLEMAELCGLAVDLRPKLNLKTAAEKEGRYDRQKQTRSEPKKAAG